MYRPKRKRLLGNTSYLYLPFRLFEREPEQRKTRFFFLKAPSTAAPHHSIHGATYCPHERLGVLHAPGLACPWLKSLRGEVLCNRTPSRHGGYEARAEDRKLQQQHHQIQQEEQAAAEAEGDPTTTVSYCRIHESIRIGDLAVELSAVD